MIENHVWQDNLKPKTVKKFKEERMTLGVSEVDTWSFDQYLLRVLHNGLEMLAETAHGVPVGIEFDWIAEVRKQAANAYWCCVTYEELEMTIYKKYHTELTEKELNAEGFDLVRDFINNPKYDASDKEAWIAETKSLWAEREGRKNELLNFVKKYFWTLWD